MKEYIGDGVYAEVKDGQLFLTTENGRGTTNTVIIDRDTYQSLMGYLETYSGLIT
jgi:hypothetical protein